MSNIPYYIDVILPLPIPNLFTYKINKIQAESVRPGIRVTVQFGKRKIYTALIRRIHNNKPAGYNVKDILSIIDVNPLVNEIQLKLWEWISDYYMCSPGEVYKAAMPSGFKLESETKVFSVTDYSENIDLNETEMLILSVLEKENVLSIREIESLTDKTNVMSILKSMLDKKVIYVEEKLKEGYKPKIQTYVRLNTKINNEEELNRNLNMLEKAPRQLEMMIGYLSLSELFKKTSPKEVEKSLLIKRTNSTNSIINSLVKKGILELYDKEVGRLISKQQSSREPIDLNTPQKGALSQIKSELLNTDVVLFHGVTSSGKTEIYIHLINEYIKKGKQVLYLLPEIALTAQIINRLKNVFGDKVGVYHSKFSDNERIEIWKNILGEIKPGQQQLRIILGARSSLFLPFDNLGLIIIDEEHENTYKQFDPAPRYHARDTAIMLSKFHRAKVLMGTATPSIESYFNAQIKKFGLVELNTRYLELEMPEIIIIDVREARRKKKMKSFFSPELLNHISEALGNKEQVILFQNRRGFSPYIECDTCGWIPYCKHCDVSLTYHKHINKVNCHYCGYSTKIPKTCDACGSNSLLTRGFGTEKIEDEISLFFPEVKVARMDLDSTRTRKSYERIISDFENGKIDILVGTQMVTKGLDFNNVRVVGILNADNMLNFPDFRSYERSYQLMAQVSGRAGRKNGRGIVIVQTSDPKNIIIQNVEKNDYLSMYKDQLNERKSFNYPPFYRLIEFTLKHRNKQILDNASSLLANDLKAKFGKGILGPESPLISKIQNLNLNTILFKLDKEKSVAQAKKHITDSINYLLSRQELKSVQVVVNVDPL